MADTITILRPGSRVQLGDIEVTVSGIEIRGACLLPRYEISWFCNGDRKSAWVEEFELSGGEVIQIGIKG